MCSYNLASNSVSYHLFAGIFVSRLSDGLPEHFFAGLLGLGDEILEINDLPVNTLDLNDVYDLMANSEQLMVKTLPFSARPDVSCV